MRELKRGGAKGFRSARKFRLLLLMLLPLLVYSYDNDDY